MHHKFTWHEIVNGACIFTLEGRAVIEPELHGGDEWTITRLEVDGFMPSNRPEGGVTWVDVDMPEDHWLFKKIMLDLLSPAGRLQIDFDWNQHVAERKAEMVEA